MEQVADFFLSPVIGSFLQNFNKENHRTVIKILVKTMIKLLAFQEKVPKSISELQKCTSEMLNARTEVTFFKHRLQQMEKQIALLQDKQPDSSSKDESTQVSSSEFESSNKNDFTYTKPKLAEKIYPNWWLGMCQPSSPPSKQKVEKTERKESPTKEITRQAIPNLSESIRNIRKSPEKSPEKVNMSSSFMSSYAPSPEMKDFYQEQFRYFLDSQRDFFQGMKG
jgi:hypothetical protein